MAPSEQAGSWSRLHPHQGDLMKSCFSPPIHHSKPPRLGTHCISIQPLHKGKPKRQTPLWAETYHQAVGLSGEAARLAEVSSRVVRRTCCDKWHLQQTISRALSHSCTGRHCSSRAPEVVSDGWGAIPGLSQAAVHRAIIKSDCEPVVRGNLSRAGVMMPK